MFDVAPLVGKQVRTGHKASLNLGQGVAVFAATATPTAQPTSTALGDCAGLDAGVDVGDCRPTHAPATCVRVVAQSEAESKSN